MDEQLAKARKLRALGMSWMKIMARTGIGEYRLRCELDNGFREKMAEKARDRRIANRPIIKPRRRAAEPKRAEYQAPGFTASQMYEPSPVVPRDVLFERKRALKAPRSLTALCCGDPAPGRSALDKRKAE